MTEKQTAEWLFMSLKKEMVKPLDENEIIIDNAAKAQSIFVCKLLIKNCCSIHTFQPGLTLCEYHAEYWERVLLFINQI